jgi:hypothetical protein
MAASDIKSVFQLGIVTGALDRAMDVWTKKVGVGPWDVTVYDRATTGDWTVDGEPADFEVRVAIARIGGFVIELIEPTDGDSAYGRSLAEHGGADHIHHVLCTYESDDFEAAMDDFGRKGIATTQTGHMAGTGIKWAYLDTRADLGFDLEFVHMPGGLPSH